MFKLAVSPTKSSLDRPWNRGTIKERSRDDQGTIKGQSVSLCFAEPGSAMNHAHLNLRALLLAIQDLKNISIRSKAEKEKLGLGAARQPADIASPIQIGRNLRTPTAAASAAPLATKISKHSRVPEYRECLILQSQNMLRRKCFLKKRQSG